MAHVKIEQVCSPQSSSLWVELYLDKASGIFFSDVGGQRIKSMMKAEAVEQTKAALKRLGTVDWKQIILLRVDTRPVNLKGGVENGLEVFSAQCSVTYMRRERAKNPTKPKELIEREHTVDGGHRTTLVEVKVSRADFVRDGYKPFRRDPEQGMGEHRWYFVPDGLITEADLPARWGLAVAAKRGVRIVRRPTKFGPAERNVAAETSALYSCLQRATEGWGRRVFTGMSPPMNPDGDPHPTASAVIRELRQMTQRLQDENTVLRRRLAAAGVVG